MIRTYNSIDARRLKNPNKFSDVKSCIFALEDPNFYKATLVSEDSSIHAIICFMRYWGNNFAAFFLISDNLTGREAVELKKFIYQAVDDFQADRVQTDSVHCEVLTKWHEFLGFRSEGVREKMLYNKDYEMWSIVKGRDY